VIVVLDTNILVSAFLSPFGAPGRILDLALAHDLQLAYDDRILIEYESVLARPRFGFDMQDVHDVLDILVAGGIAILAQPLSVTLPDPTDQAFLEVASEARAPLITGNHRHFPAKLCGSVRVFAPAEFINWWINKEAES
jgi:uncharacterized protein